MTGAIYSHPSARLPAPVARFGAALTASAVAHWMLLSAPPLDLQRRAVAPGPDGVPITVRLAPAPVRAPSIPLIPDPEERRPPLPVPPPAERPKNLPSARSASGTARADADTPALPPMPDPNYYLARELDGYPRLLTPLRIDWPARDRPGEVRLEILIDEHGVVRDVAFAGTVRPGGVQEDLRALLAATPFYPAVKDGRAVRSRIVLRLDPGIVEREP